MNYPETLSTVKFAQRAKSIKNTYRVNLMQSPDVLASMINQLKAELSSTRTELRKYKALVTSMRGSPNDSPSSPQSRPRAINFTQELQNGRLSRSRSQEGARMLLMPLPRSDATSPVDASAIPIRLKALEDECFELKTKLLQSEADNLKVLNDNLANKMQAMTLGEQLSLIEKENQTLKEEIKVLKKHLQSANDRIDTLVKEKGTTLDMKFTEYVTENVKIFGNLNLEEYFGELEQLSIKPLEMRLQALHDFVRNEKPVDFSCEAVLDLPRSRAHLVGETPLAQLASSVARHQFYHVCVVNHLLERAFDVLLVELVQAKARNYVSHKLAQLHEDRAKSLSLLVEKYDEHHRFVRQRLIQLENGMKSSASTPPNEQNSIVSMLENKIKSLSAEVDVQMRRGDSLQSAYLQSTQCLSEMRRLFTEVQELFHKTLAQENQNYRTIFEEIRSSFQRDVSRQQDEINKLNDHLVSWVQRCSELSDRLSSQKKNSMPVMQPPQQQQQQAVSEFYSGMRGAPIPPKLTAKRSSSPDRSPHVMYVPYRQNESGTKRVAPPAMVPLAKSMLLQQQQQQQPQQQPSHLGYPMVPMVKYERIPYKEFTAREASPFKYLD
eukprot:TRINITY_DN5502_c0_g1_i1.p1 TRINITY_DN5502_c0_g1~~TRINITY_DN5502_c0_g1_i1.p1  ORF type:complete len:608 (-),score=114.95 TRINITY_DN5502_c0_g1_i1:85-1908(-)